MPTTVFLNGRFVERGDARISAFDAGFQHAVGLFETMIGRFGPDSRGGKPHASVFRVMDHIDRLVDSAKALGLSDSLEREPLAVAVEKTVEKAALEHCRVRLTLTGGDMNLLAGDGGRDPTIMIVAQEATRYPPEMFERGARVAIADTKANPLNPAEGHKTLSYWWRLRELQAAAGRGLDESLVFQISNHLAGGCVSNAFIVKDDVLITPIARGEENAKSAAGDTPSGAVMPSPVLPGITRDFVLDTAAEKNLATATQMLSIDDVLDADEVFVTNSSFGVLPVVSVEAESIRDGKPGPIAQSMRDAWRTAIGSS